MFSQFNLQVLKCDRNKTFKKLLPITNIIVYLLSYMYTRVVLVIVIVIILIILLWYFRM